MAALVPLDVDVLAGLELGGMPVVTLLSHITGLPARFVRKQAKSYGTGKLAEGGEVTAKRVVVIEDIVTSAGQIIASTIQLRALGAIVSDVLCVIDRESGGTEKLAQEGLRLRALFTMSELKSLAQQGGGGDALPRAPHP
jgi:orotate phosphoribosyltransferase